MLFSKVQWIAATLPAALLLAATPFLISVRHDAALTAWSERQAENIEEGRLYRPPETATEEEELLFRAFYMVVARPIAWAALFEDPEASVVAIAVGAAEGTRTPDGGFTSAYSGHSDPGNGVWNLGTFSYQHGANSPQEADRLQIQRLEGQANQIVQHAHSSGVSLSFAGLMNAVDLANQAPRAALGSQNFIDHLKTAKEEGLSENEAILEARTRSFVNPATGQWNAPGLGNTEAGIRRDQWRRMERVAQALANQPQEYQTWLEDTLGNSLPAIASLREAGVMDELTAGIVAAEDGSISVTPEAFAGAIWQFGVCGWSSKLGDDCLFSPPQASLEQMQNDFAWEVAHSQGLVKPSSTYICPAAGTFTSGWGWRERHPITGDRRFHAGADIAAPVGTPIHAAAAGKVEFSAFNGNAGYEVKLRHDDGSSTRYIHNDRNLVQAGARVNQGDVIAAMGSTGASTGPHLHFELYLPGGQNVNPLEHVDCESQVKGLPR